MNEKFFDKPITTNKELLTPEETAELLRVSTRTVYEMLRANKLPAIQIGRQWRIKSSELLPSEITQQIEESCNFYLQGNVQQAIYQLQQVLEKRPNYGLVYWLLGTICGASGRASQGVKYLEKAIELNPEHKSAYHNLGLAYNQTGLIHLAIGVLKKAIDLGSDWPATYYELGFACLYMSRYSEAIDYLKEAIRLEPDNLKARYFLSSAYKQAGHHRLAIEQEQIIDETRNSKKA